MPCCCSGCSMQPAHSRACKAEAQRHPYPTFNPRKCSMNPPAPTGLVHPGRFHSHSVARLPAAQSPAPGSSGRELVCVAQLLQQATGRAAAWLPRAWH